LAIINRGYTDETPSGMPAARQSRTQSPRSGDPPAALSHRLRGLFYEVHAPSGLCLCSSEFYSPNRF